MSYGSYRSLDSEFSDVSHVEDEPHPWWESQGPPAARLPDGICNKSTFLISLLSVDIDLSTSFLV